MVEAAGIEPASKEEDVQKDYMLSQRIVLG
jgi:hypothetical protein